MRLTTRDIEILDALVLRVRMLSRRQIAETWFSQSGTPLKNATARMAELQRAGFVVRKRVPIRALPDLSVPVIAWNLDDDDPEFELAAETLKNRWRGPPRMTRVYVASDATANAFGRDKKPFSATQATHDLGLADVYTRLRKAGFMPGQTFIGEDVVGKAGEEGIKDPDAFLVDADWNRLSAIEFGGRYDVPRVTEFHQHCKHANLPYSVW